MFPKPAQLSPQALVAVLGVSQSASSVSRKNRIEKPLNLVLWRLDPDSGVGREEGGGADNGWPQPRAALPGQSSDPPPNQRREVEPTGDHPAQIQRDSLLRARLEAHIVGCSGPRACFWGWRPSAGARLSPENRGMARNRNRGEPVRGLTHR